MQIISGLRGAGKTTRLIELASKHENSIVLVRNANEVKRLEQKYPHMKHKIMTWDNHMIGMSGFRRENVFIDDADGFLWSLVGKVNVVALTRDTNSEWDL